MIFVKKLLKKVTPPIFLDLYRLLAKSIKGGSGDDRELLKQAANKNNVYWEGIYSTWEEAQKHATGYSSDDILQKVKDAALKVKRGEAVYERDSVLFYEPSYNWSLVTCLLKVALKNNNTLKVIDFGGALGSTYFQNLHLFDTLDHLNWFVVEQKHFVDFGKSELTNNHLSFFYDIESVLRQHKANTLLLSGVISYLEDPHEWMKKFLSYGFDYIILDRVAFTTDENHILSVQHMPEWIYKASYPSWFLNEAVFLSLFSEEYELLVDFFPESEKSIQVENLNAYWKGFFLKKRIP